MMKWKARENNKKKAENKVALNKKCPSRSGISMTISTICYLQSVFMCMQTDTICLPASTLLPTLGLMYNDGTEGNKMIH